MLVAELLNKCIRLASAKKSRKLKTWFRFAVPQKFGFLLVCVHCWFGLFIGCRTVLNVSTMLFSFLGTITIGPSSEGGCIQSRLWEWLRVLSE